MVQSDLMTEDMTTTIPYFQPFSWQGFSFNLPTDWNLTFHNGGPRHGTAVLSALRGKRLEIHWQHGSTRILKKQYESIIKQLANRHRDANILRAPEGLTGEVTEISVPSQRVFLVVTPFRLYECSLPPHVERAQALEIMASMQEFYGNPAWHWHLYGIDGVVPRHFKLATATLLPGGSRLEFRRFWMRVTLGSFSRAAALLSGKSLREFAMQHISLIKHHPDARPLEDSDVALRYTITLNRFGITTRHCLLIEYRPDINVITYRHER